MSTSRNVIGGVTHSKAAKEESTVYHHKGHDAIQKGYKKVEKEVKERGNIRYKDERLEAFEKSNKS